MIEKHEISVMMKAVARVVKEYVDAALGAVAKRVDDIDGHIKEIYQRFKEIPAGPKGEKGDLGERGDPGISVKGDIGEAGPTGLPGPKGDKGDPGESIVGPAGERGEKGETGIAGISVNGERGEKGDQGESIIGPVGPKGEDAPPVDLDTVVLKVLEMVPVPKDGAVGPKGESGERGEQGLTGKDGERGEIGPAGITGPIGLKGEAGENGEVGLSVKGDPGEKGERGERGEKGESGLSIKGEKGDPGTSGIDGKDGQSVHPDTVSLMIVNEVKQAVAAIPRAKDGENGRDAIQVDILPSMDENRSYPRGTYSRYRGGVIRAIKNTDPMIGSAIDLSIQAAGWEVIMDGIADVNEVPTEDPREFIIDAIMTNGTKKVLFKRWIPVPLYKGIWRDGTEYVHGDEVTRDGLWFCNKTATRTVPGNANSDWTLCVKRGDRAKEIDMEAVKKLIDAAVAKAVAALPKPKDGKDLTQMNWDGTKH